MLPVRTRIASSRLSYGDFCQMQVNAVSEIKGKQSVFIQLALHIVLIIIPVAVVARELPVVRDAARADPSAWRVAPAYFCARYVFALARARMCLDRLLHGARY